MYAPWFDPSVWFPPEQGSIVYPLQSSPADSNATPDGGDQSGSPSWGGDGEGSFDRYVAGDEASSFTQCVRVQELSVGGEEGEGDVETL